MLDNQTKLLNALLTLWSKFPILFFMLEDKGGVGKSLLAQIVKALIEYNGTLVARMLDTDHANSTSAQIHPDSRMLNLSERVSRGIIANTVQDLASKVCNHAVIDVGARDEKSVKGLLPWASESMQNIGGIVVVLRPITLGSHNQTNACAFMDLAEKNGIATVFVRNEGQGRMPSYFEHWLATKSRARALEQGAVETSLADGDARYADEAVGFGLSIADVALRNFEKVVDQAERAEAQSYFDNDICAFLNIWLVESMVHIGSAIQQAIDKRRHLDTVSNDPAVELRSDAHLRRSRKGSAG